MRQAGIINIAGIHGLDAEVIEIHVAQNSKATKKIVGDLSLPIDAMVGGIIRNSDAWIASDEFQIEVGDKVVVFALPDSIKHTLEIFS